MINPPPLRLEQVASEVWPRHLGVARGLPSDSILRVPLVRDAITGKQGEKLRRLQDDSGAPPEHPQAS